MNQNIFSLYFILKEFYHCLGFSKATKTHSGDLSWSIIFHSTLFTQFISVLSLEISKMMPKKYDNLITQLVSIDL